MDYLTAFLGGIITFVSPCLLPMLPVYISFFAGGDAEDSAKRPAFKNSVSFVIGFSVVFVIMGAFAGTLGGLLSRYSSAVNIVFGVVVILFGLSYLGAFRLPFFSGLGGLNRQPQGSGVLSAFLFGVVFSFGWTPCVSTILGTALMLAAQSGSVAKGVMMLLLYSVGLGIPFIISAVLIERLKSTFDFIKKHYRTINMVSGILLIVVGVLMATGNIGYYLSLLTF